MPEPWDKNNPPEEFWGSRIDYGPMTWGDPSWHGFFKRGSSIVRIVAILLVVFVALASEFSLLWALIVLVAIWIYWPAVWLSVFPVPVALRIDSLYYLCFEDRFRVRVDSTRPYAYRENVAMPVTETVRFTEEDVKSLSLSEQLMQQPGVEESTPVVQLNFLLQDGSEYRHDHFLASEWAFGEYADHGRFLELLDRLEAILGRERIEGFVTAREAVERAAK